MTLGTLADHIHKRLRQDDTSSPPLSWVRRLRICIGAAQGLDYLHTGTGIYQRIIHRDVKSTNILLDQNFEAKVSDFGLSRTSPANQADTFVSTQVKGSFGYFDPDYFRTQRLTRKSDVYALGVVLFEVLCGRPAVYKNPDNERINLAGWAQQCFKEKCLGEIIDPGIKANVNPDSLEMFVKVAIQCLHIEPKQRPTMAQVVVGLDSALALQENFGPEMITSDDNQEETDISYHEVINENSENEMQGISSGRHQKKRSSVIKRFFASLSPAGLARSVETGDSDSQPLSWKLRISIAHGAAKGLAYLHSPGVNVIHRDVKRSSILIDSEYNAKLSGFCCARNGPEDERSHVTTLVRGTLGYLDPEYFHSG
nr:PREDICTED: receptor-like protein kinase ANXUR2 [Daucus carota subsp. sativus]